jgi:hypothetical protein
MRGEACEDDARCAFREGRRDLLPKFDRLLARVRREPLELVDPTTGEPFPVTYQDVVYLTLGALYGPDNSPELAVVLQELWEASEARADVQLLRQVRVQRLIGSRPRRALRQEEPYLGLEWTGRRVHDSDNPSDPFVWQFWAHLADRLAPYFGSPWLYFALQCATWPVRDVDRYTGPWNRETANPVL